MEWISGNRPLSRSEMENNATIMYGYFLSKGWTLNAVSGLLGNTQSESGHNPGAWQGYIPDRPSMGYGLVQWTPMTKLKEWAESNALDYTNGYVQCDRIEYERNNGVQWIATSTFPYSFDEFATSMLEPYTLGRMFLLNYERPKDQSQANQDKRGKQAEDWYKFLSGVTPPAPPDGYFNNSKLPFWMLTLRSF